MTDRSLGSSAAGASDPGIGVLIVDDHAVFRRGLRELLEASGFGVVGEAGDAADAVALASQTAPEVVLMDVKMPGASGVEATRRLRAVVPDARVVMLTVSPEEDLVIEALAAGACGYLLKDAGGEQITDAVRAAAAGESALSPRVASALVDWVREAAASGQPEEHDRPALTGREREVLRLIVEGRDNHEIAAELVISPETVKSHVSAILEKLGADNRVQAAVEAVRARLV